MMCWFTVDQNLPYQQNLADKSIAILILVAKSNRYAELRKLAPKALEDLKLACTKVTRPRSAPEEHDVYSCTLFNSCALQRSAMCFAEFNLHCAPDGAGLT